MAATARPAIACPPVQGETEADVAVVGGGFTGLSAALHLAERGLKPALLEAAEPGWGASGRNGGQVIAGLKADPTELIALFGPQKGKALVDLVGGTADFVFELIGRHGIQCDAVRSGWLQAAHSARGRAFVPRRRMEDWRRHGAPVRVVERDEIRHLTGCDDYIAALLDERDGALNPLGYARGLADAAVRHGARIHGGSPVQTIERKGAGWRVARRPARSARRRW